MNEPLWSPTEHPTPISHDELESDWAAFAEAITDDHRVVVGQYGKLGGGPRSLRLAIAGNSALQRLVELLRGIHDDVGESHGGLIIEASLDEDSGDDSMNPVTSVYEWALVSVEFAEGECGEAPQGPLLAAMTNAARVHGAAERMTARDLAVQNVGAPAPPSMPMRDVPSDLRPLAAALLAHRIPVIDAGRNKGSAWLRVAAQDVQEVRWLGDALSRIHSQLLERRSDAVLALGEILWEQRDRSISKRCLGWQEIRVELEDTASERCLRKVDLVDATQAVLDEEGSVPFGRSRAPERSTEP
jgi:hypothetical protein